MQAAAHHTDWDVPRPARITRRTRETADTFTFELDVDGPFRPGQFNMLGLPGAGEVPVSISGAPGGALVHTVRSVGRITSLLERLEPGDYLGLRGPFGTGWPMEQMAGRDVVIAAGGIGLAPLRPVLYELARRRERFGRVALLYGARTPEDLLYRDELEAWRETFDVEVTVDAAATAWKGHVGVITTLIPSARFDPDGALAVVCGPEAMMRFTVHELYRRDLDDRRIYVSMERNMKCAAGLCGHCQFGPAFVCKDGPVFRFDRLAPYFQARGL